MGGTVCHGLSEAFRHDSVNIGWYPMRAIAPLEIRSLPGPGAGQLVGTMRAGATCGRQSVRNPDFKPNPSRRRSLRRAGQSYVWVYSRSGAKTGWAPVSALVETGPSPATQPLRGPAGHDFEVGHQAGLGARGRGPGCGKRSRSQPIRHVRAQTVLLRYSAKGTAKHYLHHRDRVRVLIANASGGFHFVQIVSTGAQTSARRGARGWVSAAALEPA